MRLRIPDDCTPLRGRWLQYAWWGLTGFGVTAVGGPLSLLGIVYLRAVSAGDRRVVPVLVAFVAGCAAAIVAWVLALHLYFAQMR